MGGALAGLGDQLFCTYWLILECLYFGSVVFVRGWVGRCGGEL